LLFFDSCIYIIAAGLNSFIEGTKIGAKISSLDSKIRINFIVLMLNLFSIVYFE